MGKPDNSTKMHTVGISQSYSKHLRETLTLAWPVILGHMGHMVISQADTIMIGRLGKVNLAAATLANSMFFLPLVIGIGIAMAISPLVAQALGAERRQEVKLLLSQSFLVGIWSGVFFIVVSFGVAELLPYLGQDPEVVPLAQDYLRIIGLSALPMLIYLGLKHYCDGFEDVIPGMLVMAFIVVLNIFGNWLLINGHWGLPALGLRGAGWATFGSRLGGCILVILYIGMAKRYRPYIKDGINLRHHIETIKRILKIGLPSGFQYFFEVGAFSGAVVLIGWISPDAQSAHQIALGIPAVTYMVYLGLSAAASIRVGNALGRKDKEGIRKAGMAAMFAGAVFIVISTALILPLHNLLPSLYIDDMGVETLAASLLIIAAIFQVGDGFQAICLGALRGMEDVRIPTIFTFIAYWAIGLPVGYTLMSYFDMGAEGIWYGLTAGMVFSALVMTLRFERLTR